MQVPFTFVNCGSSVVNVNSGTLDFAAAMGSDINLGALNIADGAAIAPATTNSPTVLVLNGLSVGNGSSLDVANNEVMINYGNGPDPIGSIAALIASGYANGAWSGARIFSSTAQSNSSYGLGYADAADAGNPAGLQSGQIEILYTLLGDANLDGKVNGADFAIVASNFNTAVTGWDQGDFNYDEKVNGSDFAFLAANFNQGSQIAVAAAAPATTSTVASTTAPQTSNSSSGAVSSVLSNTAQNAHTAKAKPRHTRKA
jgi:hypothetical protein